MDRLVDNERPSLEVLRGPDLGTLLRNRERSLRKGTGTGKLVREQTSRRRRLGTHIPIGQNPRESE